MDQFREDLSALGAASLQTQSTVSQNVASGALSPVITATGAASPVIAATGAASPYIAATGAASSSNAVTSVSVPVRQSSRYNKGYHGPRYPATEVRQTNQGIICAQQTNQGIICAQQTSQGILAAQTPITEVSQTNTKVPRVGQTVSISSKASCVNRRQLEKEKEEALETLAEETATFLAAYQEKEAKLKSATSRLELMGELPSNSEDDKLKMIELKAAIIQLKEDVALALTALHRQESKDIARKRVILANHAWEMEKLESDEEFDEEFGEQPDSNEGSISQWVDDTRHVTTAESSQDLGVQPPPIQTTHLTAQQPLTFKQTPPAYQMPVNAFTSPQSSVAQSQPSLGMGSQPSNSQKQSVASPNPTESTGDTTVDKLVAALGQAFGNNQQKEMVVRARVDKDLPLFDGKPSDWENFKSEYDRTTARYKYEDSENLTRLRKALRGNAYDAVRHLLNNPANLKQIWSSLKARFGRPEFVLEYLTEEAKAVKPPDASKPDTLVEYGRAIEALIVNVCSYNAQEYMVNRQLVTEFVGKLPTQLKSQWYEWLVEHPDKPPNLQYFWEWLQKKVNAAVLATRPKVKPDENESNRQRQRRGPDRGRINAIQAEKSEAEKKKKSCWFCNKDDHRFLTQCPSFKAKSADERFKYVKNKKLCFACISGKHSVRDCRLAKECTMPGCNLRHHPLLHPDATLNMMADNQDEDEDEDEDDVESNEINLLKVKSSKPLSIVPVVIDTPSGPVKTYAMLDSGANTTVIERKFAEKHDLNGPVVVNRYTDVTGTQHEEKAMRLTVTIRGCYPGAEKYSMEKVTTINELGMSKFNLDADEVKSSFPYLARAKLKTLCGVVPTILIGEDHPYLTAHREILERSPHEPMAKRTKLGWVLAGDRIATSSSALINALSLCQEDNTCYLEQLIKEFFTLEAFGVVPRSNKGSIEDQRALAILEKTTVLNGDRWESGLLWKQDEFSMPESKTQALNRLISIEKKMARSPEYAKLYKDKMIELAMKKFIRQLSPEEAAIETERTWYLPHFGVYNPNKPGKIRFVVDAKASNSGKSLNDYLLTGPDLNRPLVSILWNFRRHNIALMGDIEDMFPRVTMREVDQQSQRILWRDENGEVVVYIMIVLIFGSTSSPTTAIFVKNKNAERFREQYPKAVMVTIEDMYMDDCCTGDKTVDLTIKLRKEINIVNSAGGFHVKKWISNSPEVVESIPQEYRAVGAKDLGGDKSELSSERVLGLWWDPIEDVFTFKLNFHKVDTKILEGCHPTKRQILGLVMSLFDPVGYLGNFKVKGVMLIQATWRSGVGWDDLIPESVFDEWKLWVDNLHNIVNVKIPRKYCHDIDEADEIQLHTFVDASEEAFAAVCYLRIRHGEEINVAFVASKARVAPIKKRTIPQLELLGGVMGSRLATNIGFELKLPINSRTFWMDSKLVLQQIRSVTLRHKEFVANRIGEIQENTNPSEWRWIPTAMNVADEATRLKSKVEFSGDSTWLRGPKLLLDESKEWPEDLSLPATKDEDEMEEKRIFALLFSSDEIESGPSIDEGCGLRSGGNLAHLSSFSSYTRLLRTFGVVVFAAKKWKGYKRNTVAKCNFVWTGQITGEDVRSGEQLIYKFVQEQSFEKELEQLRANGVLKKKTPLFKLQPYLDAFGLMRIKGRLGDADVNAEMAHPVILPKDHPVTAMLILNEHNRNGHQGQSTIYNALRERFWILDARTTIRRITTACLECQFRLAKPIIPEMGNMPHFRLESGRHPFTFTGVDYFGPIEVTVGRHHEKRWVALFTCMVTRAIHLEVAYGLTTDEMLMALQRFISARGRPHHIFSDRGTNFVGSDNELKKMWNEINWESVQVNSEIMKINWNFQPAGSPHMSGVWERLVQSVKKVLKSTLHERYPKDQTLLTLLKGAENILNSRPLTYVSNDPLDPESLTPNHFLRGFSDMGEEIPGIEAKGDWFREQWKRCSALLGLFWTRWTKEYLPTLLLREKWHEKREPLAVGDIVLIVDENQPRINWIKGFVSRLFPGKDGQVRVVNVAVRKYKQKKVIIYKRSAAKVVPLGIRMDISSAFIDGQSEENGDRNVVAEMVI